MQNFNSRSVRHEVQAMQQKTTYFKPTKEATGNKSAYLVLAIFAAVTIVLCGMGVIPIY